MSTISYSMPVLSSSLFVNLHWVHAGFEYNVIVMFAPLEILGKVSNIP